MDGVSSERRRRLGIWELLGDGLPRHASPVRIGEIGIRPHRTGHGIYRDLENTVELAPHGVALSLLHTGASYADDLSEDGILYHYPRTSRRERDQHEIASTKAAMELNLPIFVVEGSKSVRRVFLGWVTDYDDDTGIFLIEFDELMAPVRHTKLENGPFRLKSSGRKTSAPSGQRLRRDHQFKFNVLRRYGSKCAVCEISTLELIDAAHLCPVRSGGSDDPRNGLPLCANHHRALDRGLLKIDPETLSVRTDSDIGVTTQDLRHLPATPHPEALAYLTKHVGK